MKNDLISICEKVKVLLPESQQALLLGFSGGVDSVVLAKILLALKIPFELAHVNYQLRGEESEINMRFCQEFAVENNLTLHLKIVNSEEKNLLGNDNLQAVAREIRYDWFLQIINSNNLSGLLTAHHADDQIETVLLHQFRGAGLQGLTGMSYLQDKHYRPLLDVLKAEIEGLASSNNWVFSSDSSNLTDTYNRNFIRNQLIPTIGKKFPSIKNSMLQNIRIWQDEAATLNYFINEFLMNSLVRTERGESLSIAQLHALPSKRSVLHAWVGKYGFNDAHFNQLEQVYQNYQGEKWFDLHGRELRLLRDRIELINSTVKHLPTIDQDIHITLGFESTLSDDYGMFKVAVKESKLTTDSLFSINLPENALGRSLQIRRWREGDKIKLRGLGGSKKLSDLFINKKLDSREKLNTLVILYEAEIIAVWPLRVAEGFDQKEKGQFRLEIDLLKSI